MKAHRLFDLDRRDLPTLRSLGAVFIVTSACTVMLASLSKALFLASMAIRWLPWMFLGSALLTVVSSLLTVAAMRRFSLRARFTVLLGAAVASFVALRLAYPFAPSVVSVMVLLWGPAVGHLAILHAWNVPTTFLPTRQAKRMVPVLAAVTTVGAAFGGLAVQGLLELTTTENLLLAVAALLLLVLVRLGPVFRELEGGDHEVARPEPVRGDRGGAVGEARRAITRQPLLRELALAVFLLQTASVIIDYQFSAELQPQYDKEGIARFLGGFYWISNVVVVALTLGATRRVLRLLGIGLAIGTSALVIGGGSVAYLAARLGVFGAPFWVIAATAFAERVTQYAFTKPAMQMVYMPLADRGGAHAKTIIDGVVHRLATVAVSCLLIVAAPELATQLRLSPPAIFGCLVVVLVGVRLTPHYRRAIFQALSSGQLEPALTRYLRQGLGRGMEGATARRLASDDPQQVVVAIEVAAALQVPLEPATLHRLVLDDRPQVAAAAMSASWHEHAPSLELLSEALAPARPVAVLRALIDVLGEHVTEPMVDVLRPLARHTDPGLAIAASVLRIRAAGASAEERLSEEIRSGRRSSDGITRLTGMTRARDFARELPQLLDHPDETVRRETVAQMGALGLRCFVPPLIGCLTIPALRSSAMTALCRHGNAAVSAAEDNLSDPRLATSARLSLLRVLARVATPEARDALLRAADDPTLRDHAVHALWELCATEEAPQPDPLVVEAMVQEALDDLERHAALERCIAVRLDARHRVFVRELEHAIVRAEARVLRLLGLLYDRDAIHRAYLHYRSGDARRRSNAIELLDQTVTGEALKAAVRLLERAEGDNGTLRPRSVAIRTQAADGTVDELVERCGPWAGRLWRWAQDRANQALDADHELDRVAQLAPTRLCAELSVEAIALLAVDARFDTADEGTTIIERGHPPSGLHILLQGQVRLGGTTAAATTVEPGECFGVVACLDGEPHLERAVVEQAAQFVVLDPASLDEVSALEPRAIHALVRTLARRVHDAVDRREATA